jgi:hypothetical protein
MKKLLVLLGVIGILLFSNQAQAITIVETGESASDWGGPVLGGGQWLAARFDLSQPYTITDIYGWIKGGSGSSYDGIITLAIYPDLGGLPNGSQQLFADTFSTYNPVDALGWHGLSGLDWSLGTGQYWAAFEVRDQGGYSGYMTPVVNPLGSLDYAYSSASQTWNYWENGNYGIKIYAEQGGSVVPEPATLSLLGLGLLGLAGLKRKEKK